MERSKVLDFVNKSPQRFFGKRIETQIEGERALASKDMKGHLIVSWCKQVFEFFWDKEHEQWV